MEEVEVQELIPEPEILQKEEEEESKQNKFQSIPYEDPEFVADDLDSLHSDPDEREEEKKHFEQLQLLEEEEPDIPKTEEQVQESI